MQKLKFAVLHALLLVVILSCSSSVDTTKFNSEQYFEYAMKLYNDGDYELALQEFQTVLLQFPGSAVSDDAQFYIGMTYFKKKQYLLGAYEFSKLVRNMPASPFVPQAQFMLAECYYQLSPPFPLDQTYTKKAIDEYQAFIDFFPTNPKVEEAENKIKELTNKLAEKEYNSALIYEKMEYQIAAMDYYGNVADTYHDTKYGPLALYRKIQLEVKRKMKDKALADINTFLIRYPNNERVEELKELETSLNQISSK
ncbi:outer membrane protein assembly factor BamD [Melioribacteraceae bacterium 4301-Me]|uniref:outer membrane protein assembly factor BamD n=1 Tax=Pyranulibacter aquaticus TaxID=3163344 RepID=UPI00359A81D3